jgi:hypothetical protein
MQGGQGSIVVIRRGPSIESRTQIDVGRSSFVSGALADPGVGFTVAVELEPGQMADLSGMQLEVQPVPSPFREASAKGGVYTNAHWGMDELLFSATAPNSFSVNLQIEAHV